MLVGATEANNSSWKPLIITQAINFRLLKYVCNADIVTHPYGNV